MRSTTQRRPLVNKQAMIHFMTRRLFDKPAKQLAERQRLHLLSVPEVYAEYLVH